MNAYLEDAGIFRNAERIKAFEKMLSNDELLNLHIILRRKFGLPELIFILRRFKKISSLELIVEPKCLSSAFIKFTNGNKKIGVLFVLKQVLGRESCRKIEKCKGVVRIYDYVKQEFKLSNERNVLITREDADEIRKADIYNLISKENPMYQCVFSSCLGHTIYVAKNGDVSFCPAHIEESHIGTFADIENVFENEVFYDCLKKTIEHRNRCKSSCEYFDKCKGGCPFEDNCSYFKESYLLAMDNLLQLEDVGNISEIPLYMELALLNKLCSKIRNVRGDK